MHQGILTGLGSRGIYWLKNTRNYEGCQLVAFVEPSEANRQKAVEQHEVPADAVYASVDEAVAATKGQGVSFVLDVTPPAVHQQIAETAFANGLHVLGEKPLSDDYQKCLEVVAKGKQAGLRHMITQNYRFGAQPRTIGKLVREGKIGDPGQFDIRFYKNWADFPGSHYVTQSYMLINDMMVHHFDLIRFVTAQDPTAVTAITWNHPWGWHAGDAAHAIVFEFPSGLRATHIAVACAVGEQTTYNGDWRIEGPRGSLSLTGQTIRLAWLHRAEQKIDEEIPSLDVPPAEKAMLDEFFAAIEGDREPECSAEDNLASVAMVFAAIKSAKENRRVELAELAG